jgi:hypothetical protein
MLKRLAIALVGFWALPLVPAQAQDFETQFGNVDKDGIKICSAVVPGNWRNDLMVPLSWGPADCKTWTQDIAATDYSLACLHDHLVQYDFTPGWNNSCGW